jgi:protein-disulfide isomerase
MLKTSVLFPALWVFPTVLSGQSMPREPDEVRELRRNIEFLKQGQEKIQKDLASVLDLLTGKKPPLEDIFIKVADRPSLGQPTAKVTIVEFTDFQCPFCSSFARDTLGKIINDYVNSGKVRYVIRNFPLEQAHPLARKAAEASLCADELGRFWALHDRFFADQTKLALSSLPEHAVAIGVEAAALRRCVESGRYSARVADDIADGRDLEVGGTPTFFIGYPDPNDPSRMRAVRTVSGIAPYREFQKLIAEALEASVAAR